MASIVITDLVENCSLDTESMAAVTGGLFDWIRTPTSFSGSSPVVNQFITLYQAEEIYLINQSIENTIIDSPGTGVDVDLEGLPSLCVRLRDQSAGCRKT